LLCLILQQSTYLSSELLIKEFWPSSPQREITSSEWISAILLTLNGISDQSFVLMHRMLPLLEPRARKFAGVTIQKHRTMIDKRRLLCGANVILEQDLPIVRPFPDAETVRSRDLSKYERNEMLLLIGLRRNSKTVLEPLDERGASLIKGRLSEILFPLLLTSWIKTSLLLTFKDLKLRISF